jgi:hypothetical protein
MPESAVAEPENKTVSAREVDAEPDSIRPVEAERVQLQASESPVAVSAPERRGAE